MKLNCIGLNEIELYWIEWNWTELKDIGLNWRKLSWIEMKVADCFFNRAVWGVTAKNGGLMIAHKINWWWQVSLKLADRSREKAKIRLKSFRGEELDRERKRRTNRMLIAMVTIFGASWLPLNLVNLVNDVEFEPTIDWFWTYQNLLFFFAHIVAMSSTCYNVFLYAWLNDSFRKELKRVLPLCFQPLNTTTAEETVVARANNRQESHHRNGQSARLLNTLEHGVQDVQVCTSRTHFLIRLVTLIDTLTLS